MSHPINPDELIKTITKAVKDHENGKETLSVWHNDLELCSWFRHLLKKIEGMQWKIDVQERVQSVSDDHYREKVMPIRHLWPMETNPGIGQIVEMFQQTREELALYKKRLAEVEDESANMLIQERRIVEQVKAERDKALGFSAEIIRIAFDGGNADGGQIQEIGVKHGLLAAVEYDPELHGECDWAEPGDDWYTFTSILSRYKGEDTK